MQSLSSFLIPLVLICTLIVFLKRSFRIPFFKSVNWRKYTLKCICWCVKGEVKESVWPGEQVNSLSKRYASWYQQQEEPTYGAFSMLLYLKNLEQQIVGGGGGDTLTLTSGITRQATKQENQLLRKERFSLFNTSILNLYCKSYWVL